MTDEPELVRIARELAASAGALRFGAPVAAVYNPLEYAFAPHAEYLRRFGKGRKEVLLLGMNPGPFGMAQTGVPFGEVAAVRDWLGIDGFSCARSEVSGQRLWGWARDRFGTPAAFFRRFFVHNYCPLVFMTDSGSNLTPDKLPARERAPLLAACDDALRAVVRATRPRLVIGVGAFAEQRAREALGELDVRIGRIPHPSPASPLANRGWAAAVERELRALNVEL